MTNNSACSIEIDHGTTDFKAKEANERPCVLIDSVGAVRENGRQVPPKPRPASPRRTGFGNFRSQGLNWRFLRAHGESAPDEVLSVLDIGRPPVDIREVLDLLGVRVFLAELRGWASMLEFQRGEPTIYIDRSLDGRSLRMSIAAQLGNIALNDDTSTRVESEYDEDSRFDPQFAFAADLLMPLWMMGDYVSRYGSDFGPYARAFDVPTSLVRTRLKDVFQIG